MNMMTKLKKLSLRSKLETIARAYGAGIGNINVANFVNSVKNWSNGDVFGKANVANFDNFVNS